LAVLSLFPVSRLLRLFAPHSRMGSAAPFSALFPVSRPVRMSAPHFRMGCVAPFSFICRYPVQSGVCAAFSNRHVAPFSFICRYPVQSGACAAFSNRVRSAFFVHLPVSRPIRCLRRILEWSPQRLFRSFAGIPSNQVSAPHSRIGYVAPFSFICRYPVQSGVCVAFSNRPVAHFSFICRYPVQSGVCAAFSNRVRSAFFVHFPVSRRIRLVVLLLGDR